MANPNNITVGDKVKCYWGGKGYFEVEKLEDEYVDQAWLNSHPYYKHYQIGQLIRTLAHLKLVVHENGKVPKKVKTRIFDVQYLDKITLENLEEEIKKSVEGWNNIRATLFPTEKTDQIKLESGEIKDLEIEAPSGLGVELLRR